MEWNGIRVLKQDLTKRSKTKGHAEKSVKQKAVLRKDIAVLVSIEWK